MNTEKTTDIDIAGIFRDISKKPYYADQNAIVRLNRKFAERDGKVAEIPISRLIATQARVRGDYQEAWLRYDSSLPTDLPVVVKYKDSFYVSDGHHRIVAQHMQKVKVVKVFILDLDGDLVTGDLPLFESGRLEVNA